jgi:hypothetical protein
MTPNIQSDQCCSLSAAIHKVLVLSNTLNQNACNRTHEEIFKGLLAINTNR